MFSSIVYAAKESKWQQGKGGKSFQSIITVKKVSAILNIVSYVNVLSNKQSLHLFQIYFQDTPDQDIKKNLVSQPLTAPHVVLFMSGEELNGLFVVAYGVYSKVNKRDGVMAAILKLLGLYYVFDLE